ncbi:MAG: glycoside hydrolase family 127 protein [Candidatus Hydrogenedentes bacterium]|nr:glycoside hydrolase family 127 protein [Candidatus Hydrogenedentota bacterium]
MNRVLLSACLFSICVSGTYADDAWWNPDWQFRQCIDLNTSLLSEDLANFPLSLRIDLNALPSGAVQSDARDVRFVDISGNVLSTEIARTDGKVLEATVLVPRIAANTPVQSLYMYFGNPKADSLKNSPVWDKSYRAVLHLNGNLDDSSGKGAVVTAKDSVTVGDGASFAEPGGHLAIDPAALAGIGEQITIVTRFRAVAKPDMQTLASGTKGEGPEEWFNFGMRMPNTLHTNAASRGNRQPELNLAGITPDEWHSASVVYDARTKTRTVCIDGTALQKDNALTGPLEVKEVRIGRGVAHFESWRFNGVMDEVRVASAARSDSWLRAETACLAESSAFYSLCAVQKQGDPPPPPGAFSLTSPASESLCRGRTSQVFAWSASPGARNYAVKFYEAPDAKDAVERIDAGLKTSIEIPTAKFSGKTLYWNVVASNDNGTTEASRNKVSFYDWSATTALSAPQRSALPVQDILAGAQYDLHGYLRTRIDNIIRRYFLETPESSPAILQVFRDRDKTPVRDPLMPWAGEFAGKYLTGAELTWRVTRDTALKETIDTFVRDLIACQGPDGYLGPFPKSTRLTGPNWDIWGHYHCMLGLMLYYEDTGYEPALDACRKAADLLFETFGPGGPTLTCDGSGGQMNMAVCHSLVLLYLKTGVPRYLDLAKYIVHDAWNEPGAGHYLESALAGKRVVEFPQHRWEAIHDWQALAELYWLTGDEQYKKGFEHIWRDGLSDRHNTGGATAGEGFVGHPYDPGAIETCCTIAWIAMSIDMLRMTGESRVADEIEWSTLNSALGAIPYSGRACAYNVPMNGTRTYGVELSWQSPKAGPDLNCCAVNANRAVGMIADWGLMKRDGGLVVNFYGPGSMIGALDDGNRVALTQNTEYPASNHIEIAVNPDKSATFPLWLRIPFWSADTKIAVNGERVANVKPETYAELKRAWKAGDVITIEFDFTPRLWRGEKNYEGRVSVFRGPLLMTFDGRYSDLDPNNLPVIDTAKLTFEPQPISGALPPWVLFNLKAADGTVLPLVDLSSAGQSGNHYVTWLPEKK